MAKILLMENEKILQDSNEIQVQEQQKNSEIITKENVHKGTAQRDRNFPFSFSGYVWGFDMKLFFQWWSFWKIETEEAAVVSIIPETQRETIDKISELLNAESSNEIGMSEKAYYPSHL